MSIAWKEWGQKLVFPPSPGRSQGLGRSRSAANEYIDELALLMSHIFRIRCPLSSHTTTTIPPNCFSVPIHTRLIILNSPTYLCFCPLITPQIAALFPIGVFRKTSRILKKNGVGYPVFGVTNSILWSRIMELRHMRFVGKPPVLWNGVASNLEFFTPFPGLPTPYLELIGLVKRAPDLTWKVLFWRYPLTKCMIWPLNPCWYILFSGTVADTIL